MSEEFYEGTTPDAYDPRGNRNEQVNPVPSETEGFKAPGGSLRDSIRAKINAVRPYKSKEVHVPEWDIDVEVRSLSLGARNEMMMSLMPEGSTKPDVKRMYPAIIVAATYTLDGEKVFTSEDEGWLNSLDSGTTDLIAKPAMELSGLSDDKVVEKEAGKSDSTGASE